MTAVVDFQGYAPTGGQWHMDDVESESKFDGLVSVDFANLESQALARVPSVKNMRSLTALWLAANRITKIYPGDFAGAPRLVSLTLGGNGIVSVAAGDRAVYKKRLWAIFLISVACLHVPRAHSRGGAPYVQASKRNRPDRPS